MRTRNIFLLLLLVFMNQPSCKAAPVSSGALINLSHNSISGSNRIHLYINEIKNKNIALVANHTSMVGKKHLADTLISLGLQLKTIFTPEHGFFGTFAEGETIEGENSSKSNLKLVSLYGTKRKPEPIDLLGIDVVLFDIQDVGVRFYTYISTLSLVMEACAENKIPLIVLDRPNPNGFYIDGPVLNPDFASFVGMHPVPVVYGLTIGEYAMMVNGEGWLKNTVHCDLKVVPLENYNRKNIEELPVAPSPNLRNWKAIYLYPSLCLFEGTVISVGRGTSFPFEVYGHPDCQESDFQFIPTGKNTVLADKVCNGKRLTLYAEQFELNPQEIHLQWLIELYEELSHGHAYFNDYFNKLAGTNQLRLQIEKEFTADSIRKSWIPQIEAYKKIRIKYLLYPDFQ